MTTTPGRFDQLLVAVKWHAHIYCSYMSGSHGYPNSIRASHFYQKSLKFC